VHDVIVEVESSVARRSRHVVDDALRGPAADDVDLVDRRRQLTLDDRRPADVPQTQRQRRHVDVEHRVTAVSAVRHLQATSLDVRPHRRRSRVNVHSPSNTWFPGPTRVHIPNGISIGSAVLQGSLL